MKQTMKIMTWEVMRNLRNKQFLIGLAITPVIMVVFAALPMLLERLDSPVQDVYYVVDEVEVVESLKQMTEGSNIGIVVYDGDLSSLEETVKDEGASGYIVITESFFKTGLIEIYANKYSPQSLMALESLFTNILQSVRVYDSGLEAEQLNYLMAQADFNVISMSEDSVPDENNLAVSIAFVVILFFLIFTSGMMLLQSALQEKRDRMAEVVLSSVSPDSLMQGKIIGHFFLGALQIGVWLAFGLPIAWHFLDYPVFEAIAAADIHILIFFGLIGYLLFSALFVGLGATMEDIQSASNSQGMIMMIPMLSFLFIGPVISNPDGTVATIGTLFPFTSPAITVLRLGIANIPRWELVASAVLLILTTVIIMKGAAKIFRVGMLMYGKSPDLAEIWKWMRYKN